MHSDRCERLVLRDGRGLSYTQTGPRHGAPVIYCHGAIGTPLEATVDLRCIVERAGVRYIAPSRPGIGLSDPHPGRTILSFAADIAELADVLELDRFCVVGVSAGAAYALALAHELPDRVRAVAVCSALAPFDPIHRTPGLRRRIRLPLAALSQAPGLVRACGDALLPIVARHPELITRMIAAHAAPSERERLAQADERAAATQSFLDATRGGVGGLVDDFLTYAGDWGFDPRAVGCEVQLWHGSGDPLAPVEHALALAGGLRNCRVFIDPDEGHHFFRSSLEQILAALTGATLVARRSGTTWGCQLSPRATASSTTGPTSHTAPTPFTPM